MLFEQFEKRQVTGVVGFFEDVAEITAGLMGVDQQDEMEVARHGDGALGKYHTVRTWFPRKRRSAARQSIRLDCPVLRPMRD